MIPKKDGFSIVINGAWNPNIFNPVWIHKHLVDGEQQVEIAYPLSDNTLPIQVSLPEVRIYPSVNRLEIKPREESVNGMNAALSVARKITGLLIHTPVSAFGVNFGFEENDDIHLLTSKIQLLDNASIDSDKYKLINTAIQRNFKVKDSEYMNLSVVYDADSAIISVNFHQEINEMDMVIKALSQISIERYFQDAQSIIRSSYNLDVCFEE